MRDENVKRGRGRPPTGFDKKAYDAERMRKIRAGAWKSRAIKRYLDDPKTKEGGE